MWILFITRQDGFDQMYPSVYLDDSYLPHISCVNDTSITYLNNTNVLMQAWDQWKADDSPGNVVTDFRATDIIYTLNNVRIVFADARLGASDIWYTDGWGGEPPGTTVTRSPIIAHGNILVDGVPCAGTCVYPWVLGSTHTLEAPTLMTDLLDPTNVRYRFSSWSDGGAQNHTYTVLPSSETVTAYYDPQYNITIATAPDPNLEIVVDAMPYFAPQSFWWTLGENHNLEATTPQMIDGTSRYVWQSWSDGSGQSHSVTITALDTFTATFAVEYMVNITTNPAGLDVEVDGSVYTAPVSFWWLNGSSHDLYAISPQYVNQDERFRYVDWSDGEAIAHQIIVSGPETITAYYITQYNVSFTTSPPGLIVEVDGVEYTTPVSFFFDMGSVHTMHVPSPQSINPTSQYTWQFWNDMGLQTHDITVTGPATYTASFGVEFRIDIITNPPGLNITVNGVEHTTPYSFWCPQGSSAMLGAPSPQLQTPTIRYRWDSWSDMGTQSHPIVCNMANTYTANFVPQFLINVTSEPVLFTHVGWYDVGETLTLNAPSPIESGNVRGVFSHWNDGGAQSHIVTVTAPAMYIAYYDTQFLITVTSTPVTGLDIRVSGVLRLTEYQFWCYDGSMHVIGVPSPQEGPVTDSRWIWRSWSDGLGQWHNITCTGPDTYTAEFMLQYRLTITAPQVIDFDGITRNAPYWPWCDYLSVHNIGAPSPQPQIPGSSQYAWTSWSDGGAQYHNITVTGPATYLSSWVLQYKITITSEPVGLEVLVDGVPQTTPYVAWWDESSPHSLDIPSPQEVVPGAERYVWNWWSDSQPRIHTIIVAMSQTYTAHLSHQFRVIVDSTPVNGIAVTVNGSQYTTPYSFWCDNGISVSISGIESHDVGSGVRYAFASWSDGGARMHNIQCNMPKTLTASYTTQYYLTVISACDTQGEGWYDSGTTATFSTISPCPPGATHTRYVFIAWIGDLFTTMPNASIVMDGPKTVTATWATQYYLTVDSDYGTATGEDWYYSGDTAYAKLDVDIYTVGQTRYVFAQWTGDASGTNYAQSGAVVMNAPKTVMAQWTTQYYLKVSSDHGYPQGAGWHDAGTEARFSVTSPFTSGSVEYEFTDWSGDSSSKKTSDTILMNGPKTVVAEWQDSGFLAKFWWIFPMIIAILVMSALWMMRRKRPEQEELEPREKTETPPGEV